MPEAGRIALLRPTADLDGELPLDRCVAVTGFVPDHDALAARGIATTTDVPDDAVAAVVFVPRAKAQARDLIAQAVDRVPEGAPILVDGPKANGVDALLRDCRRWAPVGEVYAKDHGKCFAFPAQPDAPVGWRASPGAVEGFVTAPGVFSADGIDPGSRALADAMPPLVGDVCDLGAGWGYLAVRILSGGEGVRRLDLVEAEHAALACARVNVADPRAAFHWADATRWTGGPYDAVVSNPPFHQGRRADPSLGRAFIEAGARLLAPGGRFWMVANRHLPYEATLGQAFTEAVVRAERDGYKVIEARRGRR